MRYWSLLFGLVAVLVTASFVYAPFDDHWWLPGYRGTNAEGMAALEEIDAEAPGVVATLTSLRALDGPADPARLEPVDQARAWLELQAARLDRIAGANYLTTRSREIEGQAARAAEAVADARDALGGGPAPEAIDAAISEVERLDELAAEALASVAGPGGSIRSPISSAAWQIDHLYILILAITGITFVGVMVALVILLWRFAARPGRRADYYHGSQRLEVIWTIIPAAILIFIALYQLNAWADIKFRNTWPDVPPLARVTARQFQWKVAYPGPDGKLGTADDLHTVNDLHFVKDSPTIVHLQSEDVLHSFFLPQLRIKQDAVPGMTIPVLFDASKAGRYELLCAELCGWGHYKMRAQVTVHETQGEFDEWVEQSLREQSRSEPAGPPSPADVAAAPGPRVE